MKNPIPINSLKYIEKRKKRYRKNYSPGFLLTFSPPNYVVLPLVCLLFFVVELALQWSGGAFSSEFGGYPDEAGHYVTGLMVRDYIAAFQLISPMRFAENYYLHYPKVAMGHWPPFFYIVQAAWTLLFTPSRASVLLLMSLLTALLAVAVYMAIRSEFGSNKAGIALGLLLIALPLIQIYSKMVMAEVLVALLSFCAVLYFGRFLDTEKWQDAVGFGILAALAILTKGNGLALALVPPFALLFSRRFHLLTRWAFWCPAFIVLVSCGFFYWLTLDMVRNGWQEGTPSLNFTIAAISYYSNQLTKITGIGLSLLVAIGFIVRVIRPCWDGGAEGKWAAVGALPLSVWAFQCATPSGLEARHLITAVPALLMFLAAGIAAVAERLPLRRLTNGRKVAILALTAVLVFGTTTFTIPKKAYYGFTEVARQLLSTPDFQKSVFLVSSDSSGEGMFISEVAMQEQRPGHIVLRASKVLAASRWDGSEYEVLYRTPEEMMSYLERIPVRIVLIDLSIPARRQAEHHRLLKETLESYPQRWELLGTYPLTRQGIKYPDALQAYRLVGHEKQLVKPIRVDMRKMLGKILEKTTEE